MQKNELDDIKTKCLYLSNEVQSTHRQVVEAKSDLEKKDRVLANKDAELKLEVDGFVPAQCQQLCTSRRIPNDCAGVFAGGQDNHVFGTEECSSDKVGVCCKVHALSAVFHAPHYACLVTCGREQLVRVVSHLRQVERCFGYLKRVQQRAIVYTPYDCSVVITSSD